MSCSLCVLFFYFYFFGKSWQGPCGLPSWASAAREAQRCHYSPTRVVLAVPAASLDYSRDTVNGVSKAYGISALALKEGNGARKFKNLFSASTEWRSVSICWNLTLPHPKLVTQWFLIARHLPPIYEFALFISCWFRRFVSDCRQQSLTAGLMCFSSPSSSSLVSWGKIFEHIHVHVAASGIALNECGFYRWWNLDATHAWH